MDESLELSFIFDKNDNQQDNKQQENIQDSQRDLYQNQRREIKIDHVKSSIHSIFRNLSSYTSVLPSLSQDVFLTIKLAYTATTPSGYEPPGFDPCVPIGGKHYKAMILNELGTVDSSHHASAVMFRSTSFKNGITNDLVLEMETTQSETIVESEVEIEPEIESDVASDKLSMASGISMDHINKKINNLDVSTIHDMNDEKDDLEPLMMDSSQNSKTSRKRKRVSVVKKKTETISNQIDSQKFDTLIMNRLSDTSQNYLLVVFFVLLQVTIQDRDSNSLNHSQQSILNKIHITISKIEKAFPKLKKIQIAKFINKMVDDHIIEKEPTSRKLGRKILSDFELFNSLKNYIQSMMHSGSDIYIPNSISKYFNEKQKISDKSSKSNIPLSQNSSNSNNVDEFLFDPENSNTNITNDIKSKLVPKSIPRRIRMQNSQNEDLH